MEKGFEKRDYLSQVFVLRGNLDFAGLFVGDDGDMVL